MTEHGTQTLVQLSARGQLTLPAEVRKALRLRAGDPLVVTIEEGRVVLSPAVVHPVERYSAERIAEFSDAAEMTAAEIDEAKRKWGR